MKIHVAGGPREPRLCGEPGGCGGLRVAGVTGGACAPSGARSGGKGASEVAPGRTGGIESKRVVRGARRIYISPNSDNNCIFHQEHHF